MDIKTVDDIPALDTWLKERNLNGHWNHDERREQFTPFIWNWHDHYNEGDQPVMWIDGLDVRMVGIGKMLGEPFTQDQQPRTSPVGFSGKTLGHVKPTFIKSEHPTPPFRYAWEDTVDTLEALKESEIDGDPANGLLLTYTHPLTGGPTLPTFACELQLLTPRLQ